VLIFNNGCCGSHLQGSYTPAWRSHVLLHLPFYGVLVPQLLELCAARMPARADSALRDAYAVLRELSFDEALVDLLEQAEAAANRCRGAEGGGRAGNGSGCAKTA
jgi:hypothetical protein